MGCSPPVVVHACASSPVRKGIVRMRVKNVCVIVCCV